MYQLGEKKILPTVLPPMVEAENFSDHHRKCLLKVLCPVRRSITTKLTNIFTPFVFVYICCYTRHCFDSIKQFGFIHMGIFCALKEKVTSSARVIITFVHRHIHCVICRMGTTALWARNVHWERRHILKYTVEPILSRLMTGCHWPDNKKSRIIEDDLKVTC
jgi:hypothetical protein